MSYIMHPYLGFGLGLRTSHYPYIFEHKPKVDWFEIISENFMDTDGKPKRNLARIKEHYPIVMHGVALSIGTVDPLNSEYLKKLKTLINWVNPAWISDHLCWTGVAHKNTHDLLPVPYTDEALKHIVQRIKQVQDYLERPIALENPSTYLEFKQSSMPEAEFIARMAEESGCNLLLDVNNVYVTCYNHRLDPKMYLDALPLDHVIQIHLSGHSNKGTHIIDTHDDHVIDEVWNLYKYVLNKAGRTLNTMIEWDDNIPQFVELDAELTKAKEIAKASNIPLAPQELPFEKVKLLKYQDISANLNSSDEKKSSIKNQPLKCELQLSQAQKHMQDSIMLGADFESKAAEWIRSKEQFLPQEQLNVYINAYRYRLHDVVAEDYPVLKAYLGNDKFYELIWAFVNKEQPTNFNIGRFALKLVSFVEKYLPKDVFAMELCKLETTISQLTDPEESPHLEHKHIEGMTVDIMMESQFYPRKALSLMVFTYPVNKYYCKVMNEEVARKPRRKDTFLAVFRHEDVVWRMDLEAAEYYLLSKLFDGVCVGDALEEIDESAAEKLSNWFSRWMRNGMLAAYEYRNN